jgi:hypothetical protein
MAIRTKPGSPMETIPAVGSTKTIAFIGWPVKSISRTCSRRSAAAAEY